MRVGSLFSGIEGFGLGFELAGMTVAWQCEADPFSRRVLRVHWDVPLYNDVRTMDVRKLPPVDLVSFGWPCQGHSLAGRRKGLADRRSGLFHQAVRVIREVKPRWIVAENVPNLLSTNGGRDLGAVFGALGELGYWWAMRRFDSQYFGVAQLRPRQFFAGCLGDRTRALEVLFEPESLCGNPPPGTEPQPDHSPAHGGRPRKRDLPGVASGSPVSGAKGGGFNGMDAHRGVLALEKTASTITTRRGTPAMNGQERLGGCLVLEDKTRTITTRNTTRSPNSRERFDRLLVVNCEGGRCALTASAAKHGNNQMPIALDPQTITVRRFTPTECERLQGFPDGWTQWGRTRSGRWTRISDTQRYIQVGNAVTVNVAEWIARRILHVDASRGGTA